MKSLIPIFLLGCMLGSPAWASAKSCALSYYGIQHPAWPCEDSIAALEPCTEIKVAFLANSFGRETACLARLLADPRVTGVEAHLINERCSERPGGCGAYEFMYGLPQSEFRDGLLARDPATLNRAGVFFTELAGEILPLIRPETVCWISPALESNLAPDAFYPLAEIAYHQFLGRCHIVYNPLKNRGQEQQPFIYEVHGKSPRLQAPCITNLDGADIALDLANNRQEQRRQFYKNLISERQARRFVARYEQCGAAFLWTHEFNGRSKRFNDPRNRTNWPSREIFDRVVSLFP